MRAQTPSVRQSARPSTTSLLLAIVVIVSILFIGLVLALAFLPSTGFEIPEPALPILDWPDL